MLLSTRDLRILFTIGHLVASSSKTSEIHPSADKPSYDRFRRTDDSLRLATSINSLFALTNASPFFKIKIYNYVIV
jgi:hypothetical protein